MNFIDDGVIFLQVLLNDVNGTEYCVNRLKLLLFVSAQLVKQDIYLPTTYTISISEQTISPSADGDDVLLNFSVMKSLCLIDGANLRVRAALEGITSKVGPASLTLSGSLEGFKELINNGPCKIYDLMKKQYVFGDGMVYSISAILSPFISSTFDPKSQLNYGSYNSPRDNTL